VGIRETLNEKPALTTGLTIGIIVIACAFILYYAFSGGNQDAVLTKQYYTVDEGTTLFEDNPPKVVPFQKDGKDAVQAMVFTCDGGKTRFVAYLERLSDDTRKKIESLKPSEGGMAPEAAMILMEGSEVKKPHEGNWVKRNSPEGQKIASVTCPNGGTLQIVVPD
jgi:hypothetical protein